MSRVLITCRCGKPFTETEKRIAAGRGKFCSHECRYRYATRRSGLTYQIKVENSAWFKAGVAQARGAASPFWRGDGISYKELHRWVAGVLGRAAGRSCERCGSQGYVEWANLSHEYRRETTDWAVLCRPCHGLHDSGPARGAATRKYGSRQVQRG